MFVRVKEVRGKRYAYLVEGERDGTKVKQKVLRYLGPLAKVAYGVAGGNEEVGEKGREALNESLRRIPLTFEELEEARRFGYLAAMSGRRQGFLTSGDRERVEGEAEGLTAIAASRFNQTFKEVGRRSYRMK